MRIAQTANLSFVEKYQQSIEAEQQAQAEQQIFLQKALLSNDPNELVKANNILNNIQQRQSGNQKSIIVDPMQFIDALGYKHKTTTNMSYDLLRRMAKTPIIHSIISTRVEQIAEFAQPQINPYEVGFKIVKKGDDNPTKADKRTINEITDLILNGGRESSSWHGDDFETFLRKVSFDTMILDQMTFEVIRDRSGRLVEYIATDGATFRLADSVDDEAYNNAVQFTNRKQLYGYYPSYVQVYNSQVLESFYPWELCMGIRNQTTDIRSNGYGFSELEILINTITSMLYSDEYNRRIFSQGSIPKGFLRIKGTIGQNSLAQFRQNWTAQVAGVSNSHRIPFVEGDEVDWVSMQSSNKDMEFEKWQQYLIKVACAVFKMDPKEAGFESGSSDSRPLFEGDQEARLKYSRDKGLRPLVRFIQSKINKYILSIDYPEYQFVMAGLDGQSAQQELESDIKQLGSFMTLKEIRRKRGLPEDFDEDEDAVMSPTYLQWLGLKQQQKQAAEQEQQGDDGQGFGNNQPPGPNFDEFEDERPSTGVDNQRFGSDLYSY